MKNESFFRQWFAVLLVVAVSVTMSACGGGSSGTASNPDDGGTPVVGAAAQTENLKKAYNEALTALVKLETDTSDATQAEVTDAETKLSRLKIAITAAKDVSADEKARYPAQTIETRLTAAKRSAAPALAAERMRAGSGNDDGDNGDNDGTASQTLSQMLSSATNSFTPVGQLMLRNFGASTAALSDAVKVTSIRSDGSNGFHVNFQQDGEAMTIHFAATDFNTDEASLSYEKTVDGIEYYLWSYTGSFDTANKNQGAPNYQYFDRNVFYDGKDGGHRNYMTYGVRTDSSALPAGQATYIGEVQAHSHLTSNPSNDHRIRYASSLRLTVNFGDRTVTGVIPRYRTREPGETGWQMAPSTNSVTISNGRIANGRLTANLRGQGDAETRSYTGTMQGEFYGPAAQEVGGAIAMESSLENRVIAGNFGAKRKQPMQAQQGLRASPATAVYATYSSPTDAGDLWDAGAAFAPLNAIIQRRDWPWQDARAVSDPYVKSVQSDGNEGVRVTYVLNGREQTLNFPSSSRQDGTYITGTEANDDRNWYWDYNDTFEGDHLSLNGFASTNPLGRGNAKARPIIDLVWGARTPVANLPTGTATYTGSMYADVRDQSYPWLAARDRLSGNLSLNANFTQSTVSGNLSSLRIRRYDENAYSALPASTRFNITNGRISNGQFTASLTGTDTNAAAPLRNSVRGFTGSALGAFYGPAAEEVGGVFTARRDEDARILRGVFGGDKQ